MRTFFNILSHRVLLLHVHLHKVFFLNSYTELRVLSVVLDFSPTFQYKLNTHTHTSVTRGAAIMVGLEIETSWQRNVSHNVSGGMISTEHVMFTLSVDYF